MTAKEKADIIKQANALSDQELEIAYYDAVFDTLGSQTERMYELGYDAADIYEQEKYEKYMSQKANVLESACRKRGIKLWEERYDL